MSGYPHWFGKGGQRLLSQSLSTIAMLCVVCLVGAWSQAPVTQMNTDGFVKAHGYDLNPFNLTNASFSPDGKLLGLALTTQSNPRAEQELWLYNRTTQQMKLIKSPVGQSFFLEWLGWRGDQLYVSANYTSLTGAPAHLYATAAFDGVCKSLQLFQRRLDLLTGEHSLTLLPGGSLFQLEAEQRMQDGYLIAYRTEGDCAPADSGQLPGHRIGPQRMSLCFATIAP